jgi:lipid-binding SYLF domain-containing protein
MKATRMFFAVATLSAATLVGCATNPPETQSEKQALRTDTQTSLQKMYDRDPSLRSFVDNAYGYAIFPSVGKGGLVAGGASGKGEVFEQGRLIGYAELNQATIGAQIGGQEFAELIVFQDEPALRKFMNDEYSFSANASAVALKSGAAKDANFDKGVAVFTLPTGGLMAEASIGGQSFNFQSLNTVNSDTNAERANYRYNNDNDNNMDHDTNANPQYHHHTETHTEIHEETNQ